MRVFVGGKEIMNNELTYHQLLDHYIENVPKKYEGSFVEANVELAKEIRSGKFNYKKWVTVGTSVAILMGALIGLLEPTSAFASTGDVIDISPLKIFFNDIYWTMFRVVNYLSIPVWAWVGITLMFSGANVEKRTTAKKIGTSLIVGEIFVIGAPWLANQIYNLVHHVFS